MPKVRVARPSGNDQIVVLELRTVAELHSPRHGVEPGHLTQQDVNVAGFAQNVTQRGCDFAG